MPAHNPTQAVAGQLPHASPSIRRLARELGVPLAEVAAYQLRLNALTGGQGRYTISLSHHAPVPPSVQAALVALVAMVAPSRRPDDD